MKNTTNQISQFPKCLWFLQLTYACVILLANWFDIRLIQIWGLVTDAGTLIFPLTFLCSDLITEVYGYKHARRAIWAGFLFNMAFVIFGLIVTHLPYPHSEATTALKFDSLIGFNTRIIIASTLSYFCAEPLNSYTMAKLKIIFSGKHLAVRFVSSTIIASLFDSFIFGFLAFYGVLETKQLIFFNLTMWLIKVVIEIIGLPISLFGTLKLKRYEQLDMYDFGTKFSIFNLDATYAKQNNYYKDG